jgi:hypothetical protein
MKYLIPLLLLSTAAIAQESATTCTTPEKIFSFLNTNYGEIPFAEFLDGTNRHMVMLVSPKTGSLTVLIETQDGKYCGIAAGTKFEPVDQKKYEKYLEAKKPENPS